MSKALKLGVMGKIWKIIPYSVVVILKVSLALHLLSFNNFFNSLF